MAIKDKVAFRNQIIAALIMAAGLVGFVFVIEDQSISQFWLVPCVIVMMVSYGFALYFRKKMLNNCDIYFITP